MGARSRLTRAAYFDLEFDGEAVAFRVEQDGTQVRVVCGDQVDVFDDVSFDGCLWQVTRDGVVLSGQAHVVGSEVWLNHQGRSVHGVPVKPGADAESGGGTRIVAPMHGRVLSVALAVGDEVEPGTAALVVEAMKMQHTLQVPLEGRVSAIHVGEGDQVATGQVLVEFEEANVMSRRISIAGASGMWGDSTLSTAQLLTDPDLDYITYECLAEITMAIMTRAKLKDPETGYATDVVQQLIPSHLAEFAARGIKVVTNAGGVNPKAAAAVLQEKCRELGLSLKVASVSGDDAMPHLAALAEAGVQEMDTGALAA